MVRSMVRGGRGSRSREGGSCRASPFWGPARSGWRPRSPPPPRRRLHGLRGRADRRRPRAPLGPRADVHAVVDERLAAHARGAARRARRRCAADRRAARRRAARAGRGAAAARRPHPPRDARARGRPRGPAQARGDRRRAPRCAPVSPAGRAARRQRGDRARRRRHRRDRDLRHPNRLGDGGIDAVNERAFDDRIERYLPAPDASARVGGQDDPADRLRALRADGGAPAGRVRARRAAARGSCGRCARPSPTGARCTTTRCPSARRSTRPPPSSPPARRTP